MKISGLTFGLLHRSSTTTAALGRALERLATGRDERLEAQPNISRLSAQSRGLAQVIHNMNEQQGLLGVVGSALETQLEILEKLRELNLRASNETLSSSDRLALQGEVSSLIQEYRRVDQEVVFGERRGLEELARGVSLQLSEASQLDLSLRSTSAESIFKESVFRGSVSRTVQDEDFVGLQGVSSDFDSDGSKDLLIIDNSDGRYVHLQVNNGNGVFSNIKTAFYAPEALTRLSKYDFDNDGREDVVGVGTSNLYFYRSNGDATFSLTKTISHEGLSSASDYDLGDLNEDGEMDVVAAYSSGLRVWLSDGEGGYSSSASYSIGTTGSGVTLTDLNGDDHRDVVVANSGSDNLTVYLGNGTGVLGSRATISYNSIRTSTSVESGDFNGDGRMDLLIFGDTFNPGPPGEIGKSATVFLQSAEGTFAATATVSLLLIGSNSMRVEDFNKDGLDDFAGVGDIYLSDGNGSATATTGVSNWWSNSSFFEDFDNDGIVDIRTYDSDFGMWTNYFGAAKSVNRLNLLSWRSASEAQEFLPILDEAIQALQNELTALSSASLQLERSRDSQVRLSESLIDAYEKLRSVDYAQATAEVTKLQIMAQAQMASITQANMSRRSVLLLLEPFA